MNIARLILNRQQQDHVQQLTDWCFITIGRQIMRTVIFACRLGCVFFELGNNIFDTLFTTRVLTCNCRFDIPGIRNSTAYINPQHTAKIVKRTQILRVGHCYRQNIIFQRDGDNLIDISHRLRNQFKRFGRNGGFGQINNRHPPLFGECFRDLSFGDEAHGDRDLAGEFTLPLFLRFEHVPQLVFCEIPKINKNLTEPPMSHFRSRS